MGFIILIIIVFVSHLHIKAIIIQVVYIGFDDGHSSHSKKFEASYGLILFYFYLY